jgi:hypothetical protein
MIAIGLALAMLSMPQQRKNVVCLGDSVTAKYGPLLRRQLQGTGLYVSTFAAPNLPLDNSSIGMAIAAKPDVVLVGAGTDLAASSTWENARDRFVPTLEATIARLRSAPTHPKVYLCLPPPSALSETHIQTRRLSEEILPLMKQAARETDCPTIDFDAALRDRSDLVDGLQPNDGGIEMLVDTVADALSNSRKADWRIVYVDSEESDEGPAKNAIDGDPDTYWHTNYSSKETPCPHEIVVDTGAVKTIGGFSYLPRQDGVNGRVAKYEFYVSLNGTTWGEPAASGVFPRGSNLTKISFAKPVPCRYFKFRALSEQQGQVWASVGELDVLKFYPKRQ